MSAPHSPGGASCVSESRSAATASLAPCLCSLSAKEAYECTVPSVAGYCTSAPQRLSGASKVSKSPSTMVMPWPAARVLTTALIIAIASAAAVDCGRRGGRKADEARGRVAAAMQAPGVRGQTVAHLIQDDHGLKVHQRLEPSLRHLRLVWRVLGVPPWVLEDVAQDDCGRLAVVVAHTHHGTEDAVGRDETLQL
eukprot:scaffold154110_cov28-Tisochrysis_lutea.AAC.3